jgi:uncharacterized protein YjiS (DUF1127 family)
MTDESSMAGPGSRLTVLIALAKGKPARAPGRRALAFLHEAFERRRLRRHARAAARAMHELDDHLLRDIGLKRADLLAAAYSPGGGRSPPDTSPTSSPPTLQGGSHDAEIAPRGFGNCIVAFERTAEHRRIEKCHCHGRLWRRQAGGDNLLGR